MKHGKNLTRQQKILLGKYNLNCENWLCERETENVLVLIHRHTGTVRRIEKDKRERNV